MECVLLKREVHNSDVSLTQHQRLCAFLVFYKSEVKEDKGAQCL